MTDAAQTKPDADREMSFTRLLDAPRASIWRCWSEPELLMQWFCPKPWKVTKAEMDMRPGGANFFLMNGPNGEEMPNRGVYLDVVPNERIVFTDAFTEAWRPSQKAFFVGTIEMADEGGKTRYTATVRHWTTDDCATHKKMGFYEGWGIATDQLEALARTL